MCVNFIFAFSNLFTIKTFALYPIAKTINIPDAKILDSNNISLNDIPIAGSWYYDFMDGEWHFVHIDVVGNASYLTNGCYKINTFGANYYYMFDEKSDMLTGLVRFNGNTYCFQENGMNRGSLYVGRININGIT